MPKNQRVFGDMPFRAASSEEFSKMLLKAKDIFTVGGGKYVVYQLLDGTVYVAENMAQDVEKKHG